MVRRTKAEILEAYQRLLGRFDKKFNDLKELRGKVGQLGSQRDAAERRTRMAQREIAALRTDLAAAQHSAKELAKTLGLERRESEKGNALHRIAAQNANTKVEILRRKNEEKDSKIGDLKRKVWENVAALEAVGSMIRIQAEGRRGDRDRPNG